MVNAISHVLFPDTGHGGLHQGFVAILSEPHHFLSSEHLKSLLDFAEGQFYWVEIWSVTDIENITEAEPP